MRYIILPLFILLLGCTAPESPSNTEVEQILNQDSLEVPKEIPTTETETGAGAGAESEFIDSYSAMTTYKSVDLGVTEYLDQVTAEYPATWFYSTEKNKERIELNVNREDGQFILTFPNKPDLQYTLEQGSDQGFFLHENGKRIQWYQQIFPGVIPLNP